MKKHLPNQLMQFQPSRISIRSFLLIVLIIGLANYLKAQDHTTYPPKQIGQLGEFIEKFKGNSGPRKSEITIDVNGEQLNIKINLNTTSILQTSVIGEVAGSKASNFFLEVTPSGVTGKAVLPDKKKAFKFFSDVQGNVFAEEEDIHDVVCVEFAEAEEEETPEYAPPAGSSIYTLQSLPGSVAVVYLDFDGQNVTGSRWNGGNPINAAAVNFSEAKITSIWNEVSEDFRPFNLNVTTDERIFLAAPTNRRIRVIFTTTTTAAPGSGGVAYVNSFSSRSDDPCWVFNSGTTSAAATASHEVGHTLGLKHDGTSAAAYYNGHNNWGPIMGSATSRAMVQWSRGEYTDANNQEDDLAIITKTANGILYRADEAGNTNATAKLLDIDASGTVKNTNYGIITTRTDVDVYSFTTSGGAVTLKVDPARYRPNLDVKMTVQNKDGNIVATASPGGTTFNATINATLAAGTYFLHIDGTGEGTVSAGYSDYSSLGEYFISGTVPATSINRAPTIVMNSPANNATFTAPASIAITTTAMDPDGDISKVEFFNNNTKIGESVTSPYTFNYANLSAGTYILTTKVTDSKGLNATSSPVTVIVENPGPFGGKRWAIPGTIQAENYDIGGPNVSFNDISTTNEGGVYRSDAVDIEACTDSAGGYNLAYVRAGEWLKYSVNVLNTGRYTLEARVASIVATSTFYIEMDGTNISGNIAVPNTGSRQTWTTIKVRSVPLTTGNKSMRIVFNTAQVNVNYLTYKLQPDEAPTVTLTSPAKNTDFVAPALIEITANASDNDGSIAKVEFYAGTEKIGERTSSPYTISWSTSVAGTYTITARATDNSNIVTTSSPLIVEVAENSIITATSNQTFDSRNISAYPNAFTNEVKVCIHHTSQTPVRVTVTDMTGQIIYNSEQSTNVEFKLGDDWFEGLYILKAEYNNKIITKQIMKN